jgi:hypothetical protein
MVASKANENAKIIMNKGEVHHLWGFEDSQTAE